MRLLKSVEELLYELVTWILFYPLSMWRCFRHPIEMMTYAETELGDEADEQYDDALSPPILLLITLFVANLIELKFGPQTKVVLPGVLQDERNMLLFRAIAFSIFPLLLALQGVRQRGLKLTRQTLKPFFYSQCYAAAPFVLLLDLSLIIAQHGSPATLVAGALIFAAGLIWYLAVQTKWFSQNGDGRSGRAFLKAAGMVSLGFVAVLSIMVAVALAIAT